MMPIYKPEEYDAVLEHIRQEIQLQHIQMGPALPEEDIRSFEQKHQIRLPEAYRRFLLEVGNGGDMFDGFDLLPLETERELQNFSAPFPFTEYVVEEDEPLSKEFWSQVAQGTLELIDIGDGQTFELVITGPCRGEVWHFSEMGVQPCCQRQDFLGWFERWLTDGNGVDYFAEFPYPED